jgi:hypothetical protein
MGGEGGGVPLAATNNALATLVATTMGRREKCKKKEARRLFFDSDYLHFFLLATVISIF